MYKHKLFTSLLIMCLFLLPLNNNPSHAMTDSIPNAPPATTPGWTFTGEQNENFLGQSWMPVGDVNGDRYDDLIVAAYGYDTATQTNAGRVYVFYGDYGGLDTSANWVMDGEMTDAYFGYSVAGAGDINGDGFDDVLIGSTGYDIPDPYTVNVGRVYLYLGAAGSLSTTPAWTFTGTQIGQTAGMRVAGLGDVNGDGFDDIVIGSPGWDGTVADVGLVSVFYGSAAGFAETADWTAESDQSLCNFGSHLSGIGDVNGDGYNDLIVGADKYGNGTTDEGAAFAWYGSESGLGDPGSPANADWMAESNQSTRYFAYFLGTAGDVNADGYDDVVISSWEYNNGSPAEGVVFFWYGSEDGINEGVSGNPSNADWLAESNGTGYAFGTVTGIPGDINHDGYDDVIVGCQLGTPGIYAYYGSETGLGPNGNRTNFDWHASQPDIPGMFNAVFARQAGSAGDINGDGVDDIASSSHLYYEDSANPLYHAGRIWGYYSSAGVIEGTVTYTGPGQSPIIEIGAHPSLSGPPDANDYRYGGEIYSLRGLDDGSYYIAAVIDFNGSGGPPDPTDIIALYDPDHDGNPNPVVISSANRVTGIDFEITGVQMYLPMTIK